MFEQEKAAYTAQGVYVPQELISVFSTAINNLQKRKEHLALQLNREFGNISDEEYSKQEEAYLDEPDTIPEDELIRDIHLLLTFSKVPMDACDISDALNCSINAAENAIRVLLSNIN